ncbi:SulP family inorganic anion transporter [Echinicola jeungdonensis]|uniref:Bifunctional SulP family inorganic anion transporter/carbonic anhydrase n=1 Tax=Echinicola jeungdonensis TaxID=709343 RepID=A0ABV5J9G1_9BACT|nr:SulP family inorganic anion transporter [Echinicola jeungdonensis]MDN3670806.1 SulP family inorganic anion transporter [Echinicola jeungdonensis]
MKKTSTIKQFFSELTHSDHHRPLFYKPGKDIPSGIVVFLVALPLCLGIALASGAPLITGLISGIIGGLVIGAISGSGTSVSGPAASLSAVVLVMIQQLGSFDVFLTALVIAGVFQFLIGILKAGVIAEYMPTSIIKGLLSAIGIILIISQLPYALGVEMKTRLSDYSQNMVDDAPERITTILESFAPGAIILSLISLGFLIFWDKTFLKKFKLLPPSLFVVILCVILNQLFKWIIPSLYLEGQHLVHIPKTEGLSSILTFPDFSVISDPNIWVSGFTIAIIASIATLINLEATDNLDPHKRRSPPNRELVAQGVGNTIAGLIGGIPITSVIVRSSVNIASGSETKLSTLVHGALLLVSVLFFSGVINLIPLASLAAILLVVGYKLASIALFKQMYRKGWSQFIPYIVTTVAIIFTDVLLGVLIGSAFSIFFLLRSNYFNPFNIKFTPSPQGEIAHLELSNEVSFLNKAAIKRFLYKLPEKSKMVIDASFSTYVEPDIIEMLRDFQNTYAKENNINLKIIGLKSSYEHDKNLNLEKREIEADKKLNTPQDILDYFKDGNTRYVNGELVSKRFRNKDLMDFFESPPLSAVINCIDMREPLNILLDTEIGDLIPMRAAGNLVGESIIHSAEVACRYQGCKLILIMGNSNNAFIKEALEHHHNGKENSYLNRLIEPALSDVKIKQMAQELSTKELADQIIKWNLNESCNRLLNENEYIKSQVLQGKIGICTAFFDRDTGEITFSPLMNTSKVLKEQI